MPTKPKKPSKKPNIEKGVEHFSKELEHLGDGFEKRMEQKGEEWNSWFHNTFGAVGPLLSSILGIIILAIGIRALALINFGLGSAILQSLHDFLLSHMGMFFLVFLFFSYASYVSKSSERGFRTVKPTISALGIVVSLWIAIKAFEAVNVHMQIQVLGSIARFVEGTLFWIFWLAMIVGYVALLFGDSCPGKERRITVSKPKTHVRRLYRSGDDKILGGVCGGLADYLNVDPVIIRLLWVIGTLLSLGTGIIAYIIAWIIVPRNPKHRWTD